MAALSGLLLLARRSDLGDNDETQWERQDDGTRRDPWQFNMSMPITRLDTGETFCFSMSSKGGLACINKLLRDYGNRVAAGAPGKPFVVLKTESYKHRRYGKIFTPTMPVVGWADDNGRPIKD